MPQRPHPLGRGLNRLLEPLRYKTRRFINRRVKLLVNTVDELFGAHRCPLLDIQGHQCSREDPRRNRPDRTPDNGAQWWWATQESLSTRARSPGGGVVRFWE